MATDIKVPKRRTNRKSIPKGTLDSLIKDAQILAEKGTERLKHLYEIKGKSDNEHT